MKAVVEMLRTKALIFQILLIMIPVVVTAVWKKRRPNRWPQWATIASAVASLPLLAAARQCLARFWAHPDFATCGEVLIVFFVVLGSLSGYFSLLRYLHYGYDVTVFGTRVDETTPATKAEEKRGSDQRAAE